MAQTLYAIEQLLNEVGELIGLVLSKFESGIGGKNIRRSVVVDRLTGEEPAWEVYTSYKDLSSDQYRHARVHVYAGEWLRTDSNRAKADNIENLRSVTFAKVFDFPSDLE